MFPAIVKSTYVPAGQWKEKKFYYPHSNATNGQTDRQRERHILCETEIGTERKKSNAQEDPLIYVPREA